MDDQSRSTRFRALFDTAMQVYEQKTGIMLAEHSLAEQLQSCPSAEFITTLIQDQIRASSDSRGIDRITNSIESTISVVSTLSATTAFDWAVDMVCWEVPMACSTSLTGFSRHCHLKLQYMQVSLSYLLYVPLLVTTCISL